MTRLLLILSLALFQANDVSVKEVVTVSTTAIGLAAATLGGTDGTPERTECFFTLETADVRWLATGENPTDSVGHVYEAGAPLSIKGNANLRRLRFIRDGASDATLTASCW